MHILVVTNFKKKLLMAFSVILFWAIMIAGAAFLIDTSLKYSVTIDNQLSFSCPSSFSISTVYSVDDKATPYIQASNSNYKNFIEFKSLEENFQFSYPSIFQIEKQNFPGSEILYHIELQNKKDKNYVGFVQVWNMPYSLEKFLESSKENSLAEFLSFSSEKVTVNNVNGYFWDYTVKSGIGNYRNLEVFLKKGSKLYRISYYIPENKFNEDEYNMFWKMVNSLKIG